MPLDLGGDKDPCRLLPMLARRLLRIEVGLVSRLGVVQTVGRWGGGGGDACTETGGGV